MFLRSKKNDKLEDVEVVLSTPDLGTTEACVLIAQQLLKINKTFEKLLSHLADE